MNDFLTSHHTYKTWQQATFDPCNSYNIAFAVVLAAMGVGITGVQLALEMAFPF